MGIAAIAIAATLLALWPSRHSSQQAASWPDVHSDITFKATLPANPLEIEIENLRTDTRNATKALAANFMPESMSEK